MVADLLSDNDQIVDLGGGTDASEREEALVHEVAMSLVSDVIGACDAGRLVDRHWPASLDGAGRVHVLAVGKASESMARAALARLGARVASGVVIGARFQSPGVRGFDVDHPLATERNVAAAREAAALAGGLGAEDTLLLLLSGGSSAHLTLPAEGLTLEDVRCVTDALLRAGATIDELNAVRKHCEQLKGGRLARLAHPARVAALILSDVVGDRLDVIGSGPVSADSSRFDDAVGVIERYGVGEACPAIEAHLRKGLAGNAEETVRAGDPALAGVETWIIGSRATAADAAKAWARKRGYDVCHVDTEVTGESAPVGRELVGRSRGAARPAALIIAGETIVRGVERGARGGPAQELALAAALALDGERGAWLASFATDGVDGPTDAAGAIVTGRSALEMAEAGIDARGLLARHDSYTALDAIGALLRTGPTGTNVNDVGVLVLD